MHTSLLDVRAARLIASVLLLACAHSGPRLTSTRAGAPPSPRGQWEGELRFAGDMPLYVVVAIDSGAGGWRGTLASSAVGREPIAFTSVVANRDSVALQLPPSAQSFLLRAAVAPDGERLDGVAEGPATGIFRAGRVGSAAAATIAADAKRLDASRRLAMTLVDTAPATPRPDPDSARLVTSDIPLFWATVDAAPADSLGAYLQRRYLERGSIGVRDFIPGRILSAEDLAAYVATHRAQYDSSRAANLDITRADSAIRSAFRRLKQLYPAAVFPDVYFVVGRFNSGGTASSHGLLIGAEKYRDPMALPAIVSHELIHYQQHCDAPTLLEHAFMEGSADFVGELISGTQINNAARQYGLAHERELWREFVPHFADTTYYPWMYGRPADGRPNDLGYFIGYRIAQAYYQRASDKPRAVRDIITACGSGIRELLGKSGYEP
ncbi:MAG TPA: DUF2268 domain-containing putative Zn-dependent protease [Gemmatimonadaceae bacterium]|nr:DUF2268 domain-containing putative Zn-dependent protease [Gemmatimonadaceae bacterium]